MAADDGEAGGGGAVQGGKVGEGAGAPGDVFGEGADVGAFAAMHFDDGTGWGEFADADVVNHYFAGFAFDFDALPCIFV